MTEQKNWPPTADEVRLDRAQEIRELVERLARTQSAIQKLIAGQADAVVDPRSGALILLQAAQNALQESEARYDRLVTHLAAIVFELEPDGTVIFVNDAVRQATGYSPGELTGRNWWDVFFPGERREHVRRLVEAMQAGDVSYYELTMKTRSGADIVTELSTANRYEQGKLTRILGFAINITERKRNEARLRQAGVVFDSTQNGVMITDREGCILAINNAFTAITGYTQEEVVGRRPPIAKSGRHDEEFYRRMWAALEQNGRWFGEVWNRRKNGEVYPVWENITAVKDDRGNIVNYVGVFSDISAIKQSQERLAYIAHHDVLTGAANRLLLRAGLDSAIEHARRERQRFALLYLDLDRFKTINDLHGHECGDEALRIVAERMRGAIRAEDLLARVGGDEFVVLMDRLAEPRDAGMLAEKIIAGVGEPFSVAGKDLQIGISIGISIYPDDAQTPDGLVKAADAAMFSAKQHGKNTFQFSTTELTKQAYEYSWIEGNLRRALPEGQFRLEYQPQASLQDGSITGVEALVRWNHPQLNVLLPDKFIAVAEDSGLINQIGEWVLRTACSEAASWPAGAAPVRLAVNLSARQFVRPLILEHLPSILAETGLPAHRLELEFTESALQNPEKDIELLQRLRALGVRFAIDDFGTGYSSLATLTRLPIDTLKIAQAFVRNLADNGDAEPIVTAIIAMGHSLGLGIIAEGVETRAQLELLRRQGCDAMQGYLFSGPLPADALRQLLEEHRRLQLDV